MPSKKPVLDRVDQALLGRWPRTPGVGGRAGHRARCRGVHGVAAAAEPAGERPGPRLPGRRRPGRGRDLLQALIAVRLVLPRRGGQLPGGGPGLAEVLSVFPAAGADDYLLHVVAQDADALRDFVLSYLATHPAVAHSRPR